MTSSPARRSAPTGSASHGASRQASSDTNSTPPPPDHDYAEQVGDAEGHETDPLTADHFAAICLAADRGELAEVDQ